MISTLICNDTDGRRAVAVILDPKLTFTTVEGTVMCGHALQPDEAINVAMRLLNLAREIQAGQQPGPVPVVQ